MKSPWRGPTIRNIQQSSRLHRTISAFIAAVVLFGSSGTVYAETIDEQLATAKAEAAAATAQAGSLHAEATTAQAKLNQLNAQIRSLQSQINLGEAESRKLSGQIADAQAKIAHQKEVLGGIVKTMYLNSGVSPLEMLASSSSIGDFLDQEQYRESIKSKIQDAMGEIQTLKQSLEAQQTKQERILADQRIQRQGLDTTRAEAANLLALAAQNAAAADQDVKNKNSEVAKLKAQQAAILAARFAGSGLNRGGACGGGYPGYLCNAPQDAVVDPWGMYNRECVSYAAFKVASSGRRMPYWGGRGNAYQWDDNARAAGIGVDNNPRAGDIAQTNAGPYGHVMHVDAVLGDGKIRVSQYNYNNTGEYSEMTIPAAGLNFIHF